MTSESLADRFIADSGVTKTVEEYALQFSTAEEGKGFAFVNRVLVEELNLRFAIPREQNNFEKLNIYINNFDEKNEKIKLTLCKNADDTASLRRFTPTAFISANAAGTFTKRLRWILF